MNLRSVLVIAPRKISRVEPTSADTGVIRH